MPSDGFATLVPAFTLKAKLDPPIPSAPSALHPAGLTLVNVPSGTLKSESGFPIKLDATALNCVDVIRRDNPESPYLRLDVRSFFKDAATDIIFGVFYTGRIEIDASIGAILSGSPDAKTTEFGKVVTQIKFTAGGELEELERECWVGSGRFVVEEDGAWVEYKISKVQAGGTGGEPGFLEGISKAGAA